MKIIYITIAVVALIAVLIVLVVVYVPNQVSLIPAFIALLIGTISILYSYETLLMNVKEKHSKELNKIIEGWYNLNEEVYKKYVSKITDFDTYPENFDLNALNKDPLYKDLVSMHLGKFKGLDKRWEDYKSEIAILAKKCEEFRRLTENAISAKIDEGHLKKLRIGEIYNTPDVLYPYFTNLICRYYIKEEIQNPLNFSYSSTSQVDPKTNKSITWQNVSATPKNGDLYQYPIMAASDIDTINCYLEIFNSVFDRPPGILKEQEFSYKKEEIRRLKDNLKEEFENISEDLYALDKYPIFGEKCEYVVRAL